MDSTWTEHLTHQQREKWNGMDPIWQYGEISPMEDVDMARAQAWHGQGKRDQSDPVGFGQTDSGTR